MAACKLASQGKTMADSSYDMEVQTLRMLLSRQTPTDAPVTPIQVDIKNPEDYVAPRFCKKLKGKQVSPKGKQLSPKGKQVSPKGKQVSP
jgi:kindlin 2